MHSLNLQLYARTTNNSFDEELSVRSSVALTANPTDVALPISAPAGEQIIELRLDPSDGPAAFVLHRLTVASVEGQQLYKWDGAAQSLKALCDITTEGDPSRVVLKCTSDDSNLRIPLLTPYAGQLILQLSVSHPLAPEMADEAVGRGSAYTFHAQLTEAVLLLQSTFNLALEDLTEEVEGLQDALSAQGVVARRDSDAVAQQLGELMARNGGLEEITRDLTTEIRAARASFDDRLGRVNLEERFTLLRENIQAESAASNASMRARIDAATTEMSARYAEGHGQLAAQIASLGDLRQLLREIRAQLNVPRDQDIIAELRQVLAESADARKKIEVMEASFVWRLTRPFAIFSQYFRGDK